MNTEEKNDLLEKLQLIEESFDAVLKVAEFFQRVAYEFSEKEADELLEDWKQEALPDYHVEYFDGHAFH